MKYTAKDLQMDLLDDPNIDDEYLNTMTTLAGKVCEMAEKEL